MEMNSCRIDHIRIGPAKGLDQEVFLKQIDFRIITNTSITKPGLAKHLSP